MTAVQSHILAAAMEYLKMSSTSDKPSHSMLQDELWIEKRDTKKDILDLVTKEIVQQFVDLEPHFLTRKRKSGDNSSSGDTSFSNDDKGYTYLCELLSFGLMYSEFADAIREADGNRIIQSWRFLMLLFKARQRRNYAIQGLNLLTQYHFFFSNKGNS